MTSDLLILVGVPFAVVLFVIAVSFIKQKKKKKTILSWKIGDWIRFKHDVDLPQEYIKPNKHFQIYGWDEDNVYIKGENGVVNQVSRKMVESNKSQVWRENYEKCKQYMGMNPGFDVDIMVIKDMKTSFVYGKDIELLTETECKVYLKKAIENEDYEIAQMIRERLEFFR